MKVKVRGGYNVVYNKILHKENEVLDVTDAEFANRGHLYESVEAVKTGKAEKEVKAETVFEENKTDRAMKEPKTRTGAK